MIGENQQYILAVKKRSISQENFEVFIVIQSKFWTLIPEILVELIAPQNFLLRPV